MSERDKYELVCTPDEIADMLDKTQWASEFNWDQLQRLGKYFKAYRRPMNSVLVHQGKVDKSMGILLKGKLQVVRVDDGEKRLLATVVAPQTFGEFSFFDGEPRSAFIVAYTDVEYLLMTRSALDRMAENHAFVAYRMLSKISYILSQRLRSTTGKLSEFLDVSP